MTWYSSDRRAGLPKDWHVIRRRILRRDGHSCQIRGPRCIGTATDVDHIRRGNDHTDLNLQSACRPCHAQKTSTESCAQRAKMRKQRLRPQERHPGESSTR